MRLLLLSLAETDLRDGAAFYDRQQMGVGDYFLESLFSDIDSLRLFAGIHPMANGFHRALSKRFPFAIYYNMEGDLVRVWRVLDCRGAPRRIIGELNRSRAEEEAG
jgi:hypothetical protein